MLYIYNKNNIIHNNIRVFGILSWSVNVTLDYSYHVA